MTTELELALATVKAAGYRITKPRSKAPTAPQDHLNALGLPRSPLYDPKYKIKTPRTSIARLLAPMPDQTRWVKT